MKKNARDTSFTTYSKKSVLEWTIDEVVNYAQKVLGFAENDVEVLIDEQFSGRRLIRLLSFDVLRSYGFSGGAAVDLWTEIEFEKKKSLPEPGLYTMEVKRSPNIFADQRQLTPTHLLNEQGNFRSNTSRKRKLNLEGERDENYSAKKPRLEQVKVNRRTSSLIGRDKEMARIYRCIEENIVTFYTRPSTIIISGPSGIGKTCLALHVAQSAIFDLCLTTTITPSCKLLAHEIFNDKNATTVETALENWILPHIPAGEHEKKMKVAIYVDEIQNLAVKELDSLRAGIMRFILRQKDEIAIQLIVSGVAAAFLPVDLTPNINGADIDVSSGGFDVFNLQPLDMEDSAKLLTEFLKLEGRYINFSAIVGQPAVQQALQWAGGNGRLIEFVAAKATRENDFQTLHDQVIWAYKHAYPSRFKFNISTYACLINACLAQIPVEFDSSLKSKKYGESVLVSKLIKSGIVGFNALKGADANYYRDDVVGYLSVPLFELHCFRKLLKFPLNYRFLEPKSKWTGSDFEWFVGELMTCRLNALHDLQKESITLREFFGEFLRMPSELEQTPIQLSTFKYIELNGHHKTARDINTALPEESFVVVRNGDKAQSWDVAVYVKLAVQIKHTCKDDGGTAVTMEVIREERKKVPSEIPLLFITNRLTKTKDHEELKNTSWC